MNLIQVVSLTGSSLFLVLVLFSVYKSKLKEAYALLWLFIALAMIVLSVFEKLLNFLAALIGIHTPAFALLLCLIGGMLLIIFQCTIIISLHHQKITRLTEEYSLLKEEVNQMKCKSKGPDNVL